VQIGYRLSADALSSLPLIAAMLHPIRMQLSSIKNTYISKTTGGHATRTARPADGRISGAVAIATPDDSYGFIMRRCLNTGRGAAPAPVKTCDGEPTMCEIHCLADAGWLARRLQRPLSIPVTGALTPLWIWACPS